MKIDSSRLCGLEHVQHVAACRSSVQLAGSRPVNGSHIAIIFGLFVATILTLVVVPTMYEALASLRERIMGTSQQPQVAPAPAE